MATERAQERTRQKKTRTEVCRTVHYRPPSCLAARPVTVVVIIITTNERCLAFVSCSSCSCSCSSFPSSSCRVQDYHFLSPPVSLCLRRFSWAQGTDIAQSRDTCTYLDVMLVEKRGLAVLLDSTLLLLAPFTIPFFLSRGPSLRSSSTVPPRISPPEHCRETPTPGTYNTCSVDYIYPLQSSSTIAMYIHIRSLSLHALVYLYLYLCMRWVGRSYRKQ